MAIDGGSGAILNRILTTTLDRYAPQISNELARNDGVIGIFGARNAIKVVSGGSRAVETLDKSVNSNFGWRDKFSDVPTGRQDVRQQVYYAWATYDGSVALNEIEQAMNAGESKIYDLVEAEIINAKRTIVRGIADGLRESSPGAAEPESVLSVIQDAAKASQTGNLGELSRSANSYWRNEYSTTSMDLSSAGGVESLLAFIYQSVNKGTAMVDRPDFGLCNGTLFAALVSRNEQGTRWTNSEDAAKLGIKNVTVDNATIIADPSIAAGDLYLINTNNMFIQVLKTPGMVNISNNSRPQSIPISVRGFKDAYDSLHRANVMHVTLALTCSSLQRQGIATNCS